MFKSHLKFNTVKTEFLLYPPSDFPTLVCPQAFICKPQFWSEPTSFLSPLTCTTGTSPDTCFSPMSLHNISFSLFNVLSISLLSAPWTFQAVATSGPLHLLCSLFLCSTPLPLKAWHLWEASYPHPSPAHYPVVFSSLCVSLSDRLPM